MGDESCAVAAFPPIGAVAALDGTEADAALLWAFRNGEIFVNLTVAIVVFAIAYLGLGAHLPLAACPGTIDAVLRAFLADALIRTGLGLPLSTRTEISAAVADAEAVALSAALVRAAGDGLAPIETAVTVRFATGLPAAGLAHAAALAGLGAFVMTLLFANPIGTFGLVGRAGLW